MLRFPIGQAYLWQDGEALTLIDAGNAGSAAEIEGAIRSLGLLPERLERIVLTHCHGDHIGAAGELAARWGAQVLAHRLDAPVIRGERPVPEPVLLDWEIPLYARALTGVPEAPPTPVDRELEDGDALGFGDGAYVVHAPGHTDGSIGIHLPRHGVLFMRRLHRRRRPADAGRLQRGPGPGDRLLPPPGRALPFDRLLRPRRSPDGGHGGRTGQGGRRNPRLTARSPVLGLPSSAPVRRRAQPTGVPVSR